MKIALTPAARAYLEELGDTITIESFVVAGCCTPALPPQVKVGSPRFPDGFDAIEVDDVTVYFDTLLRQPDEVVVDVDEYTKRKELVVRNWPAPQYAV